MDKCKYRANTECRIPKSAGKYEVYDCTSVCHLCLIGQLCDETSLNTRAFMDASIDKLETEVPKHETGTGCRDYDPFG